MSVRTRLLALACLLVFCACESTTLAPASMGMQEMPSTAVRRQAPQFSATDVLGKTRTLINLRGRPVALFFFCGCPWCTAVAREWGQLQRAGVLKEVVAPKETAVPTAKTSPTSTTPATLVVYTLDSALTRSTAATDGLDMDQTTLLPDPDLRISNLYRAEPCPRVFVLDHKGLLNYTNNSADDAPHKAAAQIIVLRALDALRRASVPIKPASSIRSKPAAWMKPKKE